MIIKSIKHLIILLKCKKMYFGKKVKLRKVRFQSNNKIGKNSELSYAEIGIGSYIGDDCKLSKIKIGKYCSIGSEVKTIYGKHPTSKYVTTHPFAFNNTLKKIGFEFNPTVEFRDINKFKHKIEIGNDVWIGNNVLILEGIKIGDGAIIGVGAIVVKNVPDYAIVVGVPAKVIKYRFTREEIEFLKKFRWWDKDLKWIEKNVNLFSNIEMFREIFEKEHK